jgi:uncharacterized protein (TIGR03086 family)
VGSGKDRHAHTAQVTQGIGELHLAVCGRFGAAVQSAEGHWDRPSPCAGWQARDVVEHVIGFHDALLLRPLGLKPRRPSGDLVRRWQLTHDSVRQAFRVSDLFDRVIEVPAVEKSPARRLDAHRLVPRLTQDVLVHTWDLARAVGADDSLDAAWCEIFLGQLPDDQSSLNATGMFGPPVSILDDADSRSRLLARLGRDPAWRGG